jgi:endoribonuclease Dicer
MQLDVDEVAMIANKDEDPILNPRAYQLEILEVAKLKNTLAFLPTASGKTLISLLLIQHRLELLALKRAEGSKRQCIAFLAPTR